MSNEVCLQNVCSSLRWLPVIGNTPPNNLSPDVELPQDLLRSAGLCTCTLGLRSGFLLISYAPSETLLFLDSKVYIIQQASSWKWLQLTAFVSKLKVDMRV